MNFPKHISKPARSGIDQDKQPAVAPYNFVELPDTIVTAELESDGKILNNALYHSNRHTGKFECTLTTASPLYIRCGLTTKQYQEGKEAKDFPEFYYIDPITKNPVLPGSSLRGMIRNLVEIISFSKIDRVSARDKFFFRAVAAERDDPLRQEYENKLGKNGVKVRAGYLIETENGWSVRPAEAIEGNHFIWIREKVAKSDIPELIRLTNIENYKPQYFQNVSFGELETKNNRKFATKISSSPQSYPYNGVLVTSGNMLEGAQKGTKNKRQCHCLVGQPDWKQDLIPIDEKAIQDYRDSLTPFQQNDPFTEDMGVIKKGRVIFYCEPEQNQSIRFFGHSPFFRVPYTFVNHFEASSAVDFIPAELMNASIIDIADAIFGWVRQNNTEKTNGQRAGKISFSDAKCTTHKDKIWYEKNAVTPKILASPKPATFQHYLVQPEETKAEKAQLKHYGSEPGKDTVIRGHKLYWHKGDNPDFKHPNPENVAEKQSTQIKPIAANVKFTFTIHFENLTSVELGALMWVLNIAKDENYRLKLGMGKPLGLGAVKIESDLYLSDRHQRYSSLFEGEEWNLSERPEDGRSYQKNFEEYIIAETKTQGRFEEIRRIKMLLAMLEWPGPDPEITRYMEIERGRDINFRGTAKPSDRTVNEYKERLVLPTPLEVNTHIITFTEGQEVDAEVKKIDRKNIFKNDKPQLKITITYEVKGSSCPSTEEVNKRAVNLEVGDRVKVKIEKVSGTAVRKVKRVQ